MSDWFKQIFGFTERTGDLGYQQTKSQFKYNPESDTITSLRNGRTFGCGIFNCPTVKQLEQMVNLKKTQETSKFSGKPTFNCEVVGDIFKQHSKPENKGALFQAASQFNCLEFGGPNVTPEDGITDYQHDHTQGPACSLATPAGTLYRNYFAEVTCPNGSKQYGQTKDCQINNLENIQNLIGHYPTQFFTVKNGYTNSSKTKLTQLNSILESNVGLKERLTEELKIGVHFEQETIFTDRWVELNDPSFKVSQVFSSALSIAYGGSHMMKLWLPLAEIILNGTYEATIYAGMLNYLKTGNKRVHLTQVGGGVFGNPPELITAAIQRAFMIAHRNNFPLEIILGFYSPGEVSKYATLCSKSWLPTGGVDAVPEFVTPAPYAGFGTPTPVPEYETPAPYAGFGTPTPVPEYETPAPYAGYATPTPLPKLDVTFTNPDDPFLHEIIDHAKNGKATNLKTELLKYAIPLQKRIITARPKGRMSVVQQADYFRMGGNNSVYSVLLELNLV
jgi:hypothetical protein